MKKLEFPTSHDEVLESLIELENLSNLTLTLNGIKTSNKLPSVHATSKKGHKLQRRFAWI